MTFKFKGTIIDKHDLSKFLDKFPGVATHRLEEEVYDIANDIRNYIIDSMNNTKRNTDIVYTYRRKAPHHPAMPGHPPARDFGELIGRIVSEERNFEAEVGVHAGAPYAKFLEDPDSERLPKYRHRFLRPAFEEIMKTVEDKLEKTLGKAIGT